MSVVAAVAVPHPPLIFPEIGKGQEAQIQKTIDAYRDAMRFVASMKPDTVVVTSPHATAYADYFHISPGLSADGDFGRFGVPELKIHAKYDLALTEVVSKLAKERHVEAGTMAELEKALDHGTMIPLRFLNAFTTNYKVVRIGLSALTALAHYRLGELIQEASEKLNRRVVMIASGDLSHRMDAVSPYGFVPEGPAFDQAVTKALAEADFGALLRIDGKLAEKAAECGLRSFLIMAGALDRKAVEGGLLSYEGPFGVGYSVSAYEVTGDDPRRGFGVQYEAEERQQAEETRAREDAFVALARLALETRIQTGKSLALPDSISETLSGSKGGVFVSIEENGRLRGCIGTVEAAKGSLAEEIITNAEAAGTCDPRFAPVAPSELPSLVYSVDVLTPPEAIDSIRDLDPMRYGLIVEAGDKRGLLLPGIEGVSTASEQLSIAKEKAGITPLETIKLYRFSVERHG